MAESDVSPNPPPQADTSQQPRSVAKSRSRLTCIDALRGMVMCFMCLDHSREFFTDLRMQPEDMETTTPVLFFTRWITHFCAPTFVFLAGISAWLYQQKVGSKQALAKFLFSRGIWLIFLEFTVVYFGWLQSFGPYPLMFIIIAAIGASMCCLAGLIFLPYWLLAAICIGTIFLHNILDGIQADSLGAFAPLWQLLHEGGMLTPYLVVGYPILPWIAVIGAGYCFGRLMQQDRAIRIKWCFLIGLACVVLFVLLRSLNGYGDASKRIADSNSAVMLMSFLNCTKYPPSLLYLLMTLGPALIVLAAFDWLASEEKSVWMKPLLTFGQVPLFFYVAHLYLIHFSSRILYWIFRGEPISPLQAAFSYFQFEDPLPAIYGFPLLVGHVGWILMLIILLPLCRWYGAVKKNGQSRIWSYL